MKEIHAGFVNAHTHIYSGLAPFGMPQPKKPPSGFQEILGSIWWRLDRALDERSLTASARYYVAQAILAGTTTLVDHHESPRFIDGSLDVLADACNDLGMRALLCYGATERNGGRAEARSGLAECRRLVQSNRRPLITGAVGLHASFTVSNDTIEEAAGLCRELNIPLHVHVAEDLVDVRDAKVRGFEGPLERLIELGALRPGAILAHGVHLDRSQVRVAAEAGAWLVQNPRSNRGNRVGYPGGLAGSALVALGTDGFPSDLRAEAEALRAEAALHGEDPAVAEMRLKAGREMMAARDVAADTIVIEDSRVVEVTIGGRNVVSQGRLMTGDVEEIEARAREEAARLWKRMESIQEMRSNAQTRN